MNIFTKNKTYFLGIGAAVLATGIYLGGSSLLNHYDVNANVFSLWKSNDEAKPEIGEGVFIEKTVATPIPDSDITAFIQSKWQEIAAKQYPEEIFDSYSIDEIKNQIAKITFINNAINKSLEVEFDIYGENLLGYRILKNN